MKNVFLILVLLLVFFSCREDQRGVNRDDIWDRNKLISYVQYAEDDITEVYRDEFQYDPQGLLVRAKSYLDGELSGSSYDFSYDGNKRTFMMDMYPKHNNTVTTFVEEKFLDNSFSPDRLVMRINKIGKEYSREEYSFDDKGRENGYKVYYFNSLDSEYDNYSYEDRERSSVLNIYSEGELVGKRKVKTVFFDDQCLQSKVISRIHYQGYSNTEYTREEYSFDNKGRENGYKSYYLGNLINEQKDYIYDDVNKILTFYFYAYSEHLTDDKTIRNRIKIVFY